MPSLEPCFSDQSPESTELDDTYGNSDVLKEPGSRKRLRSGPSNSSGTKACREKLRRDRLNDRFLELGSILDPGRPAKDKVVILSDAVRVLSQLRDEALKLRESNENLQKKINELKAEKNELRDEKQQLKLEKDNIERQVKALNSQPSFLPHPPTLTAPFPTPGPVLGGKMVPFIRYPGVSMWQFLPPAAVDTSQDHLLRPPVA
ncbi:transcription factor ILR3-like isoform X2 [Prosopis cineraria]|uniref:transcription factor ILR3-like isoform X2 n=1 Tax=Prosopis cineraria TaxID=364024 RepID=UPI0024109EDC|nr:transcription factor ILR3-like isoform X2 [Prosopis cineraria]